MRYEKLATTTMTQTLKTALTTLQIPKTKQKGAKNLNKTTSSDILVIKINII